MKESLNPDDENNNGVPDSEEDSDKDGVPDDIDTDDDNDGVPDAFDKDIDGDGIEEPTILTNTVTGQVSDPANKPK